MDFPTFSSGRSLVSGKTVMDAIFKSKATRVRRILKIAAPYAASRTYVRR